MWVGELFATASRRSRRRSWMACDPADGSVRSRRESPGARPWRATWVRRARLSTREVFQKRHLSLVESSCSRETISNMLGTVETLVIVIAVYAVVFLAHHAEGALARSSTD